MLGAEAPPPQTPLLGGPGGAQAALQGPPGLLPTPQHGALCIACVSEFQPV